MKHKYKDQDEYRRIAVKFQDDIELPYGEEEEDDLTRYVRELIDRWEELVEIFPDIIFKRLYTSLTTDQIRELVQQAEERDPDYEAPEFLNFLAVEVPPGIDPYKLVELLSLCEVVEYVYVESRQVPPPTSNFSSLQGYLKPAEEGIDLNYVRGSNITGHDGDGIQFVDIEKGWNVNHEDLVDNGGTVVIDLVSGVNKMEFAHGTQVLGVISAQLNGFGVNGIAPTARAKLVSIWRTPADVLPNRADAIMYASHDSVLEFGDVLLLEIQVCKDQVLLPVEVETAIFENIRLATALGIEQRTATIY
jgi:hypothetical protein